MESKSLTREAIRMRNARTITTVKSLFDQALHWMELYAKAGLIPEAYDTHKKEWNATSLANCFHVAHRNDTFMYSEEDIAFYVKDAGITAARALNAK